VFRHSPRWATAKKQPAPTARATPTAKAAAPPSKPKAVARAKPKPDPQAKFKAAQAKADEVGVENLNQDDIAGLTPDEIKLLRGY
jgi:hypothetical protein